MAVIVRSVTANFSFYIKTNDATNTETTKWL